MAKLRLHLTFRLVAALARRLGVLPNSGISPNSVKTRVSATYPGLVTVRRGSPDNGGGSWIHPKLAPHTGQWCNEDFALLVSDWIEEWMTNGRNPIPVDWDQQYATWQQRHDIRVFLKDFLRPELMDVVVTWAPLSLTVPIDRWRHYLGCSFDRASRGIILLCPGKADKIVGQKIMCLCRFIEV